MCEFVSLVHVLTMSHSAAFSRYCDISCFVYFRVVYIFGESVKFPVEDITPTYLTDGVLSTLRQADYLATKTLIDSNCVHKLSQMPIVLVPLHFDRDPSHHKPSCQRSVVIRTFMTHDFMTGVPAQPEKHLPLSVSLLVGFI